MTKVLTGLDDAPSATTELLDFLMAKQVQETLEAHYPGHAWGVNCDGGTRGILTILLPFLAPNWGYVLKMPGIYSASALKADVIRAGGEILERFGMTRGQFNPAQYHALPTNFAGDLLFDKS